MLASGAAEARPRHQVVDTVAFSSCDDGENGRGHAKAATTSMSTGVPPTTRRIGPHAEPAPRPRCGCDGSWSLSRLHRGTSSPSTEAFSSGRHGSNDPTVPPLALGAVHSESASFAYGAADRRARRTALRRMHEAGQRLGAPTRRACKAAVASRLRSALSSAFLRPRPPRRSRRPLPRCGGAPTNAPAAAATTLHYDCSKPGNMRKAACKGAVTTLPTTAATTTATVAPAKPSIFSRMLKPKVEPAAASASASPAAPATTSTASAASASSYRGKSITTDSAGATGQCRDGTYTHATHHSGACSRHGGVAKWMQ